MAEDTVQTEDKKDDAPRTKKWSLDLSPEEDRVLTEALELPPFKELQASKRKVLRMAILSFGREKSALVSMSETLARIDRTLATLAASGRTGKAAKQVDVVEEKPVRKSTKLSDEEKDDIGKGICDLLGGSVVGRSCAYAKHEVLPSGRAVSFDVTVPLVSLTEADIEKQYDPSREAWEAAKLREN